MNLYQRRKAERDAKRKLKYQEKRERLILAEINDATAGISEFELYQIRRQFIQYECGCKGEDND